MNGCEANELPIRTLKPGSCFELVLSRTTGILGVVVEHAPGSTIVRTSSKKEHWSLDTPVVPHLEADSATWLKLEEENMADEVKKVRKAKKEKPVKAKKVETNSIYELTSKESKKMLDPENTLRSAIVYQTCSLMLPASEEAIYQAVYRKFSPFRGKTENLRKNVHTFLREFVKSGHLKVKEVEVSAKSAAA